MKNANILIVDDDQSICISMQEFLNISGYKASYKLSAEEALKFIETYTIDLLIADIFMAGMSGLELCKFVTDNYDIEVIVMTGYTEYSYQEAIESGASDFTYKPVRFEELLLRIRRVIQDKLLHAERMRQFEKALQQARSEGEAIAASKIKNRIVRVIEFPEGYSQAGISILNYFSKIIQKQYPNKPTKIIIEQDDLTVRMIIVTPEGEKETIESLLVNYGAVITGKISVEEFTDDKLLAIELRNELRIAKVRIESQKELIAAQNLNIESLHQMLEKAIVSKPSKIEVNVPVTSSTNLDIQQNLITPTLILIQGAFRELAGSNSKSLDERQYIGGLIKSVEELKQYETQSEVCKSTAISKISKFFDDIQKAETKAAKIIKTTKNGIDIVRKIAGLYNQVAQWCGLPQVPPPMAIKLEEK